MTMTDDDDPDNFLPPEPLTVRLSAALRRHWVGLVMFAVALLIGVTCSLLWLHTRHAQPTTTAAGAALDPTHPPLPAPMAGGLSTLPARVSTAPNAPYIASPSSMATTEPAELASNATMATSQNPEASTDSVPAIGDHDPQVIDRIQPEYPIEALRDHEEGEARLQVALDALGNVEDVRIAHSSGSRTLDRAAADAVRNWRFRPAVHEGQATSSQLEVPVDFHLDEP